MKHAFLIIVHDSPELLERIINRIDAPNHYVFIHIDKKSKSSFERTGGQFIKNNIRVFHGGFSMVKAELKLLFESYQSPERFDYFHLLSGHDYPCKPMRLFDEFFDKHEGMSYMHFDSNEEHEIWREKISRRVNNWHFLDSGLPRYIRKLCEIICDTFYSRKVYNGELFAGWQWFSWHRSVVEFVLQYIEGNPLYYNRFKYTICSDEVFFHTMLQPYISKLKIDTNNSLRYVCWKPNRPAESLPLVLDERDFEAICMGTFFFCRKVFLGRSGRLLDQLDGVTTDF